MWQQQQQFSYRTISCPNHGALSIRKSAVKPAGRRAAFDGKRSRLSKPAKLAPVDCCWQSAVTAATRSGQCQYGGEVELFEEYE